MNPLVCCTLLTADRQTMTDRAVRCFLAQTYEPRELLIVDSGNEAYDRECTGLIRELWDEGETRIGVYRLAYRTRAIGELRNRTAERTTADIIAHFDSDDWSAPERLTQQVALLQASGKDAVGCREMLFWDRTVMTMPSVTQAPGHRLVHVRTGEAWLYSNQDPRYCLGTSLCYWRKTWEAKPFPDLMTGEDLEWIRGLDTLGVSASYPDGSREGGIATHAIPGTPPLMIAEIHGQNLTSRIQPDGTHPDGTPYWKRVPHWDARLQEI